MIHAREFALRHREPGEYPRSPPVANRRGRAVRILLITDGWTTDDPERNLGGV
jgi:hypothetical protein